MDSDDDMAVDGNPLQLEFELEDFVIVKFLGRNNFEVSECYYIGKLLRKSDKDVEIKFSEEKIIQIYLSFLMLIILQWLMQRILLEN